MTPIEIHQDLVYTVVESPLTYDIVIDGFLSLNVVDSRVQMNIGGASTTVTTQENVGKVLDLVLQERCVNISQIVEDTDLSYHNVVYTYVLVIDIYGIYLLPNEKIVYGYHES